MNGIDISHYQSTIDLTKVNADFVIAKITEGTYMYQGISDTFYKVAKKSGKFFGFYHYLSGYSSAEQEAAAFAEKVKPYLGDCVLACDYEGEAVKKGPNYAIDFMEEVTNKTGVIPMIYMSKGQIYSSLWGEAANKFPLWVAQYPNYIPVYGYLDRPWTDAKGWGAWGSPAIHQYTSVGRLTGYSKNLDLDKCYLTEVEWRKLQGEEAAEPMKPVAKDVGELASEVFDGKWGSGQERIINLTNAGYDFTKVQAEVNLIYYAKEVIAGKWGNDPARTERLTKAKLDAKAIQKKVNELLGY